MRPWKQMPLPVLVVVFCLCIVSGASAQLLHLDPLPWNAPPDSTSLQALEVQVDRFQDDKFGWSGNRLLLTVVLPAGDNATYFIRMPHSTFDYGEVSLFSRWPWVQGEEADPSWPGERRTSTFGQPEAGAMGSMFLPYVGKIQYGVALGLPVGSDRVYPLSSTSLPLRVEFRKRLSLTAWNDLSFTVGYLKNMGSGKKLLSEEAFPSGGHLGFQFDRRWSGRKKFTVSYDYESREGRKSQLLGVQLWLPWTDAGRFGISAARQLQGSLDRFAKWQFALMWRFDSPQNLPGAADDSSLESAPPNRSDAGRK